MAQANLTQLVLATMLLGCAAALVPSRLRSSMRRGMNSQRHGTPWTFEEARDYARSYGFASEAEYKEYYCPGAFSSGVVDSFPSSADLSSPSQVRFASRSGFDVRRGVDLVGRFSWHH